MTEQEIIDWLANRKIKHIQGGTAYIFEVGLRGEYASGVPEILLHEDEIDKLSILGKIVGIIYHDKDKAIRITVRHKDVT